ncbi:hypothetical protein BpHYR1_010801 [Brachionus plicatilis]|uniref:Uncharacterized protein n=1 Tax=Brachionus plicatilis TaxID=10195 RepID=A0A3M7QWK1_BRAPC|nr:hypothetical protein BpHYR1_010801 [Brachionus plicatilis]
MLSTTILFDFTLDVTPFRLFRARNEANEADGVRRQMGFDRWCLRAVKLGETQPSDIRLVTSISFSETKGET